MFLSSLDYRALYISFPQLLNPCSSTLSRQFWTLVGRRCSFPTSPPLKVMEELRKYPGETEYHTDGRMPGLALKLGAKDFPWACVSRWSIREHKQGLQSTAPSQTIVHFVRVPESEILVSIGYSINKVREHGSHPGVVCAFQGSYNICRLSWLSKPEREEFLLASGE